MMLAIGIVKGIHIIGIALWGAGLIALPLLLARHMSGDQQQEYARVRRFSHYGYTHLLTPAAVLAVAAGTGLIFLREVFVPWMFAKLVLVGGLVALHAAIGTVVVGMGEHTNERQPPHPAFFLLPAITLLGAILLVVLSKPDLGEDLVPNWLHSPREIQLPLDEVPT
ncbi:CopD family protein [Novosphingobium sp. M1R2S20]|uniref:Protoporphyrinogen IX oxidase n=1 Tax=Novosphingobium rhizovicinum TaxID=3228928 RepID=A0ABV3RB47_9SPHN